MQERYTAFVRSYYRWYNRMTTDSTFHYDPCGSLTTLQTSNLVAPVWLASKSFTIWIFPVALVCIWLLLYLCNSRFFNAVVELPRFARSFRDNVPSFREFKGVYTYLAFSFAALAVPVVVLIHGSS